MFERRSHRTSTAWLLMEEEILSGIRSVVRRHSIALRGDQIRLSLSHPALPSERPMLRNSLPLLLLFSSVAAADPSARFKSAVQRIPASEKQVTLFNGRDLSGWNGDTKYWSVNDGMIRGANSAPVPSSSYLFTKDSYRNFRLLLEVKQTLGPEYSTMHSAVCALGEQFTDKGDNAFGFKGPLLMFCHDWGIWDAYRRNRTVDRGPGPQVEKKGDWNLVEILVQGNRIRFVANGRQVFDFTDKPEMLQNSPIGLQLHSNGRKQEYHFRGLILTKNPQDTLVTAKELYTGKPEVQESVAQGVEVEQPKPEQGSKISDAEFNAGPRPTWIWGKDDNADYTLRTTFKASGVSAARLMASSDNVGEVFINGKRVTSGTEWSSPMVAEVTANLKEGENEILAKVGNQGGVAAFVLKLAIRDRDGKVSHVVSDLNWTTATKNLQNGEKVAARGRYGDGPWGPVFANSAGHTGRVPRGVFETLPGYKVEKLFHVPKDKLGSWVCIAFDNKGRLLASDQGGKGICRITLPPPGSNAETVVEHLDFSRCEVKPSGAQGMLYAFDSLYFSCNGGPGSGLYRARDLDGDDQFDECVLLKKFQGGGEHGPHSIRLSPDGHRIFVIAGNHTEPPFKAGEDLDNKLYGSRIASNWGEDLLLPRMWDANGHARGRMAPGGWIASTDADGKSWEIWSIGYRNPYDMAFNADGELFAYDADMEWDVGAPWYRPTRVVHATPGSEFGWRSGTGKWPTYYLDSRPPVVDVGPGSPVGVDFGYGLKFPAKYQRALYICDWTFGTMYAIHITPDGVTYKAEKEEFVSRTPLPLTDCAAGPDGALYFSIGGRGNQSELYRVTYVGDESTEAAELKNEEFAEDRTIRSIFEEFQGQQELDPNDIRAAVEGQGITGETVREVIKQPAMRYAMRSVLSGMSSPDFLVMGLNGRNRTPTQRYDIIVTIARMRLPDDRRSELLDISLKSMLKDEFADLPADLKLEYLRTASLALIRLGNGEQAIKTDAAQAMATAIAPAYPTGNRDIDRELCQLLVYLNEPTVVGKTVRLMNEEPYREDIDMGELLTRNGGYGRAIRNMIENQPDRNQVWYAFCLRVAKAGWTAQSRADYFRWFAKASEWSGGNSFRKFLQNIENEAYASTTENEKVMLEALKVRAPFHMPELPKPKGPGKAWTLEEVRALARDGLKGRSFENGQRTFASTRCVLCHRFAGNGGATGPDLTQLAGRFNVDALTEAILDPSKVISDQYRASSVLTDAGKTVNGRIVAENEEQISVLTDPEDSTKVVDIRKSAIEEILPSQVSIMPADLLKPLNRDEVLDLLAYLLSRGDERNPMFKK